MKSDSLTLPEPSGLVQVFITKALPLPLHLPLPLPLPWLRQHLDIKLK